MAGRAIALVLQFKRHRTRHDQTKATLLPVFLIAITFIPALTMWLPTQLGLIR